MARLINGADLRDAVQLDGLPRQATADDGSHHVLYLEGSAVRSMLAADWPPPLPSDPTPAESAAAIAARQAAAQQAQTDAQALRQKVVAIAQSAVGQPIDTISTPQLLSLIRILIWQAGALDKDGRVRPLGEWVK